MPSSTTIAAEGVDRGYEDEEDTDYANAAKKFVNDRLGRDGSSGRSGERERAAADGQRVGAPTKAGRKGKAASLPASQSAAATSLTTTTRRRPSPLHSPQSSSDVETLKQKKKGGGEQMLAMLQKMSADCCPIHPSLQ